MTRLTGRVALVTGASRGAGRAIAEALGGAGATVWVSARSSRATATTEGLPETIEETAERVTAAGGRGVAVACDHTEAEAVARLVARIGDEAGRLDLLVNNAWGGYEAYDPSFDAPLWEQPVERRWAAMFDAGVRPMLLTTHHATPLLLRGGPTRRGALIVSTVAWAFGAYMGNVLYDAAKAAIIRATFGLGEELRPHGVTALAVAPGFMRTERVLAAHAAAPFDLGATESPAYLARAIVALAADAEVARFTGQLLTVGDLARHYGFTDLDGHQPEPFRIPAATAMGVVAADSQGAVDA